MVDDAFIATWVARLRQEIPAAIPVLLKGSHARSDASQYSDFDFDVLTTGDPREAYPVYFARDARGRLIHVSVAVRDLDGRLASETEAVGWAFGLPAVEISRLLWSADSALRTLLDGRQVFHPPGEPELEDFVADLGKIRDALNRGDELGARFAAQTLASRCPSVLRPLNATLHARTAPEALELVLSFTVAPPNYRADMLLCLGLVGHETTSDDILQAAERLIFGTLDLLERYADHLADHLQPDLLQHVVDGTLRQYLAGEDAGRIICG